MKQDVSAAKLNVDGKAAVAANENSSISKVVKELSAAKEQKDNLFKEFEEQRDKFEEQRIQIANYLENANKVGLAKSFQDKAKISNTSMRIWATLFGLGIAALSLFALLVVLPLLRVENIDWKSLGFRALISSPAVWFTWFCARQYGFMLRITQDYAFKEAAAMAFVGYRDEVVRSSDDGMLRLLLESAISTFASNPTKLLLKKADAASPLHDGIDNLKDAIKPKLGK